jgi:GTPase Era involved in 16S rRNA processing
MHNLMLFLNSQDIISEHPERFFVAEIVREKIFLQYRKEIPYCCQVGSHRVHFLFMI